MEEPREQRPVNRDRAAVFRRPGARRASILLALLAAFELRAGVVRGQDAISALPPPVTRSLYRAHWFDFLSAHLEDDAKGAAAALAEMKKAARAVGVSRLSDFSRTAVYEARKAEAIGKPDRAARAYLAAIELDDASFDAAVSRFGFLIRRRSWTEAARRIPDLFTALFATREPRLLLASSVSVWLAFALAAAVIGFIVVLLVKHGARIGHDLNELSRRRGGRAVVPLLLAIGLAPLAFGLGPVWLALWWGVLVFTYAAPRERALLAAGFLLVGLLVPGLSAISRENVIERSPLWVAAVDLDERREDASAEDGLRQASGVFSEDADVWFLLGMYADRSGDSERAIVSYSRAIQADPADYRPYLNRGNVHFQEGDYKEAIRDYEAAAERAPDAAEVPYNLAVARGEAYDFDGQTAAMARARVLSAKSVIAWTDHPTFSRVVSVGYPLARARRKVEEWNRQPKSRRLPGHAPPLRFAPLVFTPFAIGPWVALAGAFALAGARSRRPVSIECVRCGAPVCDSCRRFGDHPLYCTTCVRLHVRKENLGIEAHVAQAREMRSRIRARDRACQFASLLFPGAHGIFSERTLSGFLTMFAFFFCIALVGIGGRFFDPRQLPPAGASRVAFIVPLAIAGLIWLLSLLESWRSSHGT